MQITEVTRRAILDELTLDGTPWAGRLEETDFLSRLYDLASVPSTDPRYSTARGDIHQHRFNNHDWDDDWVFYDSRFTVLRGTDEQFVRFLAEMLHPVVRPDHEDVLRLLTKFNVALANDGYELAPTSTISGRPVYAGRPIGSFHEVGATLALDTRPLLTDPAVLHEHLRRIREGIEKDPAAAIGSCKELIESLCKIILDGSGVTYAYGDDLPQLYRHVSELLRLNAEAVPGNVKASQSSQKVLRTLSTTVQSLAELRNELGLGHGRSAPSAALARHARLAHNSTVTVTEFLLDTWQDRVDAGEIAPPATPRTALRPI